ncbi:MULTISPECIES: hypothetical protein [unclassified Allomuricauda]|uniref:hypothetical protein n=1 Tax=unclassified Allomuricauda TaxID=2615049 RepID=UPI0005692B0B|nr:hypothetical protein [Muricauda sp. MAR_2010_75]
MKLGQYILLLLIVVLGTSLFFFGKNEMNAKSLIERFENGQFPITEYRKYANEDYRGASAFPMDANYVGLITSHRVKKRNKILTVGGGTSAAIIILFFIASYYENKTNPLKNLDVLRRNDIISESEFVEKKEQAVRKNASRKEEKLKKENTRNWSRN